MKRSGKVVIALGGNALLKRGQPMEAELQQRNIEVAARSVAVVARRHSVVVTHGNGPQVGLLALQAESCGGVRPYPLDILGAESEGLIGYLIEQELQNRLPGQAVATLLTRVVVDLDDPAFETPSKPIGPLYAKDEAERLAASRGWTVAADGEGFRRVVPSPEPRSIIEIGTIALLIDAGVLVVCAGGGGIPVALTKGGAMRGVEAVIDKDLSAALLAQRLGAQALLLLTDVDAVYDGWGTTNARPIRETTPAALRAQSFEPGGMAPKVEAACRFVETSGGVAAIGTLAEAAAVLAGDAGTRVRNAP
jgi:carbamate kinase